MTKELHITIKPLKQALTEFAIVFGKVKRGEKVKPHYELSFENIDTLRTFLTRNRLDLLSIIKDKKPNSIYELSKITNRDIKSIVTDLKTLEMRELVKLKKQKTGRNNVVPEVVYDKIMISIEV